MEGIILLLLDVATDVTGVSHTDRRTVLILENAATDNKWGG